MGGFRQICSTRGRGETQQHHSHRLVLEITNSVISVVNTPKDKKRLDPRDRKKKSLFLYEKKSVNSWKILRN